MMAQLRYRPSSREAQLNVDSVEPILNLQSNILFVHYVVRLAEYDSMKHVDMRYYIV